MSQFHANTDLKVGIAVLFAISDENERLLQIHLDRIRRHTDVPYRIYGAANRLEPKFRHYVSERRDIAICDIPTTNKRRAAEHSYYLERLVAAAVEDGCSHIVTMHVDSFPVKDGWVSEMISLLVGDVDVVSINGPFTSFLLFTSEFYRVQRPSFLLSEEELNSPDYVAFKKTFNHIPHSGVGYIYRVHQLGRRVHFLPTTNNRVFGGCIYHFGGAILKSVRAQRGTGTLVLLRRGAERVVIRVARLLRKVSPGWVEEVVRRTGVRKRVRTSEMTTLTQDPESYIRRLLA